MTAVEAAYQAILSLPSPAVASRPQVRLLDNGNFELRPPQHAAGPALTLSAREMDELVTRLEQVELELFQRVYIVTHEPAPAVPGQEVPRYVPFVAQTRVFTDGRKAKTWFLERAPRTIFGDLTGSHPPVVGQVITAQADWKSTIMCTLLDVGTP